MIPVLTPDEMRRADAAALASVGPDRENVFIARAGRAVAGAARRMLGGAYGKRVVVIAGKGHNGDDGRVAAEWLVEWGASVRILDPESCEGVFIDAARTDLVVDAAYGIGFRGTWTPPVVFDVPVLAVDLPSGLNALDGSVEGGVLPADRTITFAAPKMGMLIGDGPDLCGTIEVVDVGIDPDVVDPAVFLVERADAAAWIPRRDVDAHKWNHSVRVVAGSPGMTGAAALVASSAMRAGAGIVHLSWRGGSETMGASLPTEIVGRPLPSEGWDAIVVSDIERFDALVIGPGLGLGDDVGTEVRAVLAACDVPIVIDGDGIAGAVDPAGTHDTLRSRDADTILTPHDGEFAMLGGDVHAPGRIDATRDLASRTGCTILRKGPTTIVADPEGSVYLVMSGDQRLATAGSGDVLAGIIGAMLARGLPAAEAAATGAFVHGLAGSMCSSEGTIARDIVAHVADALSEVVVGVS